MSRPDTKSKVILKNKKMTLLFDQDDASQAKKPVQPHKQREMPKVRQASPIKRSSSTKKSSLTKDTHRPSGSTAMESQEVQSKIRDDCIDVKLLDIKDDDDKNLHSDPTLQKHSLRSDRKRNYREMLDGNEFFQKSKIDEEIELRQRF